MELIICEKSNIAFGTPPRHGIFLWKDDIHARTVMIGYPRLFRTKLKLFEYPYYLINHYICYFNWFKLYCYCFSFNMIFFSDSRDNKDDDDDDSPGSLKCKCSRLYVHIYHTFDMDKHQRAMYFAIYPILIIKHFKR